MPQIPLTTSNLILNGDTITTVDGKLSVNGVTQETSTTLAITGDSAINGAILLGADGGIALYRIGQTIFISGGAGSGGGAGNAYDEIIASATNTFEFSVTNETNFVNFVDAVNTGAFLAVSLAHDSGVEGDYISPFYISGLSTAGFYLNSTNALNGYSVMAFAETGSGIVNYGGTTIELNRKVLAAGASKYHIPFTTPFASAPALAYSLHNYSEVDMVPSTVTFLANTGFELSFSSALVGDLAISFLATSGSGAISFGSDELQVGKEQIPLSTESMYVNFDTPFSTIPAVVYSIANSGSSIISAQAFDVSTTGFGIAFTSPIDSAASYVSYFANTKAEPFVGSQVYVAKVSSDFYLSGISTGLNRYESFVDRNITLTGAYLGVTSLSSSLSVSVYKKDTSNNKTYLFSGNIVSPVVFLEINGVSASVNSKDRVGIDIISGAGVGLSVKTIGYKVVDV